MKISEAVSPGLRLVEPETNGMILGPEEPSLQKEDKMVACRKHRWLLHSLLDYRLEKINVQRSPDDASRHGF